MLIPVVAELHGAVYGEQEPPHFTHVLCMSEIMSVQVTRLDISLSSLMNQTTLPLQHCITSTQREWSGTRN